MARLVIAGLASVLVAAAVDDSTSNVRGRSLRGLPTEQSVPKTAAKIAAKGLFSMTEEWYVPVGAATYQCGMPGEGTASVAAGPGGCLNAQPGLEGFKGISKAQTPISFLVNPCGIVAPHTHANAAEMNTVISGEGIIAQFTTNSNKMQVSKVKKGDSFLFAQGSYHWWINLGTEQLVTVGDFVNTDSPDAALMAYDEGAGIVGQLMGDMNLLHTLIGRSSGKHITVPFKHGDSPLFPMLTEGACQAAKSRLNSANIMSTSWQVNPMTTKLFTPDELTSGRFTFSTTPVKGPGGGLRPLAGEVMEGMPFVTGTKGTDYNGGLAAGVTPPPVLWPALTNVGVGGGLSLVKFVVGYCGLVAIHTHVNAAEWNTVINGEGQVSYYQVNTGANPQVVTLNVKKGDTFVFPQGSAHWWVNSNPKQMLVTVGGFTAPFPDASLLEAFLAQTQAMFPDVTDAVLGEGYTPASKLPGQTGADTLFPLMDTRSPSNCGGEIPCDRCM